MKVYGALESAQIEWFTNAGKPAASSYPYRVIYVTDLKQIQVSDGTNWNPSAVYSYTVATLPAASASNNNQIAFITDTLQVKVSNGTEWKTIGARLDTFTSGTIPAAASNTNSLIWVSDLQQVQVSNGTSWVQVGSKAGTKNYFSQNNANPDFETNSVTPWSACTITFSSGVPSGAPTLTATQMSISTTSTTPLAGTYSMLLTKAAANAQYQGFISSALTIDREDTAKVLYGSFNYELISGTVDFSGTSTQTYEIWIYNTVSGAWTQPAGYRGMNQSSGVGKVVFSFQTDGTFANNSYRIAVITQQTGTGAIVVKFDDFSVGPQAIVLGTPVTDWQSWTPTGSWTTNTTYTGKKRRVGDSYQYQINISTSGAPNSANLTVNLPTTEVIDTLKLANAGTFDTTKLGSGYATDAANNFYSIDVGYNSTSSVLISAVNAASTYASHATVNQSIPFTFGASDSIQFSFTAPIAGLSSNVQTSDTTDTRIVAAIIKGSSGAITAGNPVILPTIDKDTHGIYNATTGKFTVPVSGFYELVVSLRLNGPSANGTGSFYLDGVQIPGESSYTITSEGSTNGTFRTYANAGQLIDFRLSMNITSTSSSGSSISILRASGPSVITATESVSAAFTTSATGTSSTSAPINFDSKLWDSHNAVTIGSAWKFTAPVSGQYIISGRVSSTTSTYVIIYKSGSSYAGCGYNNATLDGGSNLSYSLRLNAGEYIDIRFNTSASWTSGPQNTGSNNTIIITRVGN